VAARGELPLYASPDSSAPILARATDGTTFASLGSSNGWHQVRFSPGVGKAGKDQIAYVRADNCQVGGATPRKSGKPTMVFAVSPPRIQIATMSRQTAGESILVSGTALDGEQVRDVYITVYNPARDLFGSAEKVYYAASQDPTSGRLEFSADVPLAPGNNIIDIYARENDQVTGVERMWVLRTSGLAEARAAEQRYASTIE
jgi:carboxyl-terminal processing protease